MEGEILKEALEIATGSKKQMLRSLSLPRGIQDEDRLRDFGCRPVEYRCPCCVLPFQSQRTPTTPGSGTGGRNKTIIADMPTYGYRRVHAILRHNARKDGRSWPNAKRVYRVMKVHNLLLVRHTGATDDRRRDGQVAVERSNIRWCSGGFEIGCDNKENVRVAFALDCCDREAIAHVATTEGIKSTDVQNLVVTAVENRFGRINMLSEPIEWLTDNGSCFIARDTASLLREIGMDPCTTPVRSPQSNGMAEAFVKTFKRDYVSVNPTPNAETVMAQLPFWF